MKIQTKQRLYSHTLHISNAQFFKDERRTPTYARVLHVYRVSDTACLSGNNQQASSIATLNKLKNLDGPIKPQENPRLNFLCNWMKFHEKYKFFRKKSYFSRKKCL